MTSSVSIVITPATSRDLVTLADLREQLQLKPNDTAQDAWLAKVITRASRQAENYCNRIFVQQTYQDTYGAVDENPGAPLMLAQAPVNVSGLTVDGTSYALTTDYFVDAESGFIYRAADPRQWYSTSSVVVSYTGGFATIPDDVQQAVLELCVVVVRARTRDPMLRERETPGLGRETFWIGAMPGGQLLPGDISILLDPYQRVLIG